MVKSLENGVSIAPFLSKCYEMVSDESTDALISWSSANENCFVIWDVANFSSELLPKYFKHSNFASFMRQLNIYGFRKADTDRWEYANDGFVKGQKHLLKNISRRKQSQAVAQQKASQQKDADIRACEENRVVVLRKEVENLKTDKNVLVQELIKLKQHQQTSRSKFEVLSEQLKGMEKNQQQMLSFIVMAMQSPGLLVQFLQTKETSWRVAEAGKNILQEVTDNNEPSDGMIVAYQPPIAEEPLHAPSYSEEPLELDLSSDEVKDLFLDIDFMSEPLVDEELLPSESHGPFILPDDEGMLEQLLSSCPSSNNEFSELDPENSVNTVEEMNSTSSGRIVPAESDKITLFEAQLDGSSPYVDTLTERLGLTGF